MEILAPVGTIQALKAAIFGGADAVYLGLGEHNARAKCSDFNIDNLDQWVRYTHLFGVKIYITLNTEVMDNEFERVLKLAKRAIECGVDALIVSDIGVVKVIASISDIPVHISTQAGIQNQYDARFFKRLGAKRAILARETIISDIPSIKNEIDEVETFIHGAICVSFSGGCLLGSKVYGLSGNRGVCNQACRLKYTAEDENGLVKTGYLLSPYDLCKGELVKEMSSVGVDSGKIEGRLKRPCYVYDSVKYYKNILANKAQKQDFDDLCVSFNRGFTQGYSLRKSDKIIGGKISNHIGIKIGEVKRIKIVNGYKYAYIKSNYEIKKGDGAKILRNGTEVGGSDVTSVKLENGLYLIPVSNGVEIGDEVRLTTNSERVTFAERIEPKVACQVKIVAIVGKPLYFEITKDKVSISVLSNSLLERSSNQNVSVFVEKLTKFGASHLIIDNLETDIKDPVFLPLGELNEVRRKAIEAFENALIDSHKTGYKIGDFNVNKIANTRANDSRIIAEIESINQIKYSENCEEIVINPLVYGKDYLKEIIAILHDKKCYLRLTKLCRTSEVAYYVDLLKSFSNLCVYADNPYAVQIARELKRPYIAGFGLNICNRYSANEFSDAVHVCTSVECPENVGDVTFVGGKMPLMTFAHCPISVSYGTSCEKCTHKSEKIIYSDGKHRFNIRRADGKGCLFTMYDSKVAANCLDNSLNYVSFVALTDAEAEKLDGEIKGLKYDR